MSLSFQCSQVLNQLRSGPVTQLDAMKEFGILRLSERIRELEAKGYGIEHVPVIVRNRYEKECRVIMYFLKSESEAFD